ncbi:MAG: acetate/propionate family kinase, partial [Chitinivibrionales bacterium]|nr:acetate/propionate family kinase [Chitinivibrionales bacterium]
LKTSVELFKDFPETVLNELIDGSHLTTFEGNEAVIKFGEEGRFLGVLLSGSAEAAVTDNTGRKVRLAQLEPGAIFGEISLMTGGKTIANIIGVTRCMALLIPQKLFSTILITQPSAIRFLSRSITKRTTEWSVMYNLAAEAMQKSDDPYGLKLKTEQPSKFLIVNCGSSSLKYALFDTAGDGRVMRGAIESLTTENTRHTCRIGEAARTFEIEKNIGYAEAFSAMVAALSDKETGFIRGPQEISAVGHRVVHGGDKLSTPVIITSDIIAAIEEVSSLAPLHNPVNLVGIREAQRLFPHAPHVAVFDTGFHHTLPPYAYMYGLPYEFYKQKKIRRYGFHGTSHLYVSLRAAEFLKRPFNGLNIISCHLGNGASLCAVDHGRSIDTSMGFTPTQGLLMGTRSGDLDPGILIHLMRSEKMGPDELEKLINNRSGFMGLSGIGSDMRAIEKAAAEGHHRALLAYKTFCYQIRKYIGAYVAAMQGLDTVIFTGGIGQGSAGVRSLVCQGLQYMGIELDEKINMQVHSDGVTDISVTDSRVRLLVIPTDEERMIARETIRTVASGYITDIIQAQKNTPVPIEVSAHHVHLTAAHVEALFGAGHGLTPQHELSQHGQFACTETVNLIGPKGRVERVRVLGPVRPETQIEIAMTEQFKLGVQPPVRESGDLSGSPGLRLEGPAGAVTIDKGVICALRHIHMSTEDALKFGLRDKFKVRVRIEGDRELVFGDVLIRVNPDFRLSMHIDTDEANAGNIATGAIGHIEAVQARD